MADAPALDRRLFAYRPDLADARLQGEVEAGRFVEGEPCQVIAPSVWVQRRPEPDAPIDTEALMGERVTVFDEHEGYAWVQIEDGYVGYCAAAALGPVGPAPTHRVSVLRTFLYPGPSLKLPPIGHLSLDSAVAAFAPANGYAQIATGGFLFADHLAPATALEPDFVAVAERFLGTPYLWGGKTSLGLDCSGLIQLSLARAGRAVPRDTDLQERAPGTAVPVTSNLSGLMRGDLVFWKGHVGVMVDATRLLHANGHHMLTVIEPLAEAAARIETKGAGQITSVKRL